jgi:hypothetical protein
LPRSTLAHEERHVAIRQRQSPAEIPADGAGAHHQNSHVPFSLAFDIGGCAAPIYNEEAARSRFFVTCNRAAVEPSLARDVTRANRLVGDDADEGRDDTAAR